MPRRRPPGVCRRRALCEFPVLPELPAPCVQTSCWEGKVCLSARFRHRKFLETRYGLPPSDRRQLVLPVATTIFAGRDGQSSRPPANFCAGHRLCRYTVSTNSIDTHHGSRKGHYVNRPVRGFRPPGSRRISSACFRPSRLRMRRIIRPLVATPAIQSTPIAAHSVATIAHLPFSLAGTILIPDCAPPKRLSPALFPQLPAAPIYSSGRSRP